MTQELEPNLRNAEPGARIYDGGNAHEQSRNRIAAEQARIVSELADELGDRFDELVRHVIDALAPAEAWAYFGRRQGETPTTELLREIERGGQWKIAGILAIGNPTNTADVTVTLSRLTAGADIRVTAKRTDPAEIGLNVPVRTLDGSFDLTIAGGAATDTVLVMVRLQRTGARLGGGKL